MTDAGREANELLKELEAEEQIVSARRRKLHERIAMFPDTAGALEHQERELSSRRRELHEQIDALRGRLNLPRGRPDPGT